MCEAHAIRGLDANVIGATDIGTHAIEYAIRNWAVFPVRGKIPAIAGGRGVLDATTDIGQVAAWWGGAYRGCNIGARVPESMFVLDVDPRNGGAETITELKRRHGPLPKTLATISGRGDGGSHRFYRRPAGKLCSKRLGAGLDIKTATGYVVMAPSIHPDTGQPYRRIDLPVAEPPAWLVDLIRPERVDEPGRRREFSVFHGPSPADQFSDATSWADVLAPHGWRCLDADPDADGARWRHPNSTSEWSATVRSGCLFVYSPNTPFDVTEPSDPHGYTKFRAYAVLDQGGDLKAAYRAITGRGVV
ncbi:DNA primase [Mycolicibacterium tusciae]|uniref:DNA primase n=1 Tax=Mycolicibacterium tusciae TaxID=75922 RepID=A0A1X0K1D2_9MYCO|nr:DNA primase [Mycolicibacterium tusciae]